MLALQCKYVWLDRIEIVVSTDTAQPSQQQQLFILIPHKVLDLIKQQQQQKHQQKQKQI